MKRIRFNEVAAMFAALFVFTNPLVPGCMKHDLWGSSLTSEIIRDAAAWRFGQRYRRRPVQPTSRRSSRG